MSLLSKLNIFNLFSKNSSNKTITKLSKLTTDIQTYEKKRSEVKEFEKKLLYRGLYTCVSMTLMWAIIAYNNRFLARLLQRLLGSTTDSAEYSNINGWQVFQNYYLNLFTIWLPVLIFPLLYLVYRECTKRFYTWRLKRWDTKILYLRKQKSEILDKVTETETFNNAKIIFEQFDPSRLRSNFGDAALKSGRSSGRHGRPGAGSGTTKYSSYSSANTFNKTFNNFESATNRGSASRISPPSVRYRGNTTVGDISSMLPSSVLSRNQKAKETSPYSNRKISEMSTKTLKAKEAREIVDAVQQPEPKPEPKPGFFSLKRWTSNRNSVATPNAAHEQGGSPKQNQRSQSVKVVSNSSSNTSFLPLVSDETIYDDSFDLGVAVPKLDAAALKKISKQAGFTRTKKEKEEEEKEIRREEKRKEKEKKNKEKEQKSKEKELKEQKSKEKRSKSRSISRDRSKKVIINEEPKIDKSEEIAKLKAEIERLKANELPKYSATGRINKSVSDRTRSSNADLIKKNRRELIKKKRLEERTQKQSLPSTTQSSLENLTVEDISTRSSLDNDSVIKPSGKVLYSTIAPMKNEEETSSNNKNDNELTRNISQASQLSRLSEHSNSLSTASKEQNQVSEEIILKVNINNESTNTDIQKLSTNTSRRSSRRSSCSEIQAEFHLDNLRKLSNISNDENLDLETMKNSMITVKENTSSRSNNTFSSGDRDSGEVNEVIEVLDDTISLDGEQPEQTTQINLEKPDTTLLQKSLDNTSDSEADQNSLVESLDLEDGSSQHSNDPKLLTSDNSDCNPSQKDKLTDDENDNDTGNGGSGDNSKDSSKDTI